MVDETYGNKLQLFQKVNILFTKLWRTDKNVREYVREWVKRSVVEMLPFYISSCYFSATSKSLPLIKFIPPLLLRYIQVIQLFQVFLQNVFTPQTRSIFTRSWCLYMYTFPWRSLMRFSCEILHFEIDNICGIYICWIGS